MLKENEKHQNIFQGELEMQPITIWLETHVRGF